MAVLNSRILIGGKTASIPPMIISNLPETVELFHSTSESELKTVAVIKDIRPGNTGIIPLNKREKQYSVGSDFSSLLGKFVSIGSKYFYIPQNSHIEIVAPGSVVRTYIPEVGLAFSHSQTSFSVSYYDGYRVVDNQIQLYDVHSEAITESSLSHLIGKYVKISFSKDFFFVIKSAKIVQRTHELSVTKQGSTSGYVYQDRRLIGYKNSPDGDVIPYVVISDKGEEQISSELVGKYEANTTETSIIGSVRLSNYTNNTLEIEAEQIAVTDGYSVTATAMKQIYAPEVIGDADYAWEAKDISSAPATINVGTIGDELSYDIFEPVVFSNERNTGYITGEEGNILTGENGKRLVAYGKGNKKIEIDYGTPVYYYIEDHLVLKHYISSVTRQTKNAYNLKCFSVVGLLESISHVGGMYTGETIEDIIDSIFDGVTTDYDVDEEIAGIKVYGWLPYDTARENLHKLMFAYNVSILINEDNPDRLYFSRIGKTESASIQSNKIYVDGTEEHNQRPTEIRVTEHTFVPFDEGTREQEIFNNTASGVGASNELVLFDSAPIHSIRTEGDITIVESNVNYAIVNGIGIIYGIPYAHQKNTLTVSTGVQGAPNEKSVSSDELISLANSENVLERIANYYKDAYTVNADLVYTDQRCGNSYDFTNCFDEPVHDAVLQQMMINASAIVKASCKFAAGITFVDSGTFFDTVVLLDTRGVWAVPRGIYKIRIVLIGGGEGGESGYAGEPGDNSSSISGGRGGQGGNGGKGGKGGRIFSKVLDVEPGQMFEFSCGAAGAGALGINATHDENDTSGRTGGNTIFGEYSSLYGYPSDSGFFDVINQRRYALPSLSNGIKGGDGGDGGYSIDSDNDDLDAYWGKDGENVGEYTGGIGGLNNTFDDGTREWASIYLPVDLDDGDPSHKYRQIGCGGGSGACATSNGLDGGDVTGTITSTLYTGSEQKEISNVETASGNGADGVTPSQRDSQETYGNGGDGGHGGSGGGGQGGISTSTVQVRTDLLGTEIVNIINQETSHGGYPGGAGPGGDGGGGCILIYYQRVS